MESPNPFIHKVRLTQTQRIRGVVLGSLLFPVRIFLAALLFLIMWPLARLRFLGVSPEQRARPVSGWRRWLLHPLVWALSRGAFFCLGFLWVRVKGKRADVTEAPVLVAAPHRGFLDMIALLPTQLPTVVSRSENTSLPVIGALLEYNQAVMVSRTDHQSRKQAVTQLNQRLTSRGYWPQMLMFSEGTTTNGKALIKFKPGAFLAGVPVQPVLLRYPNKVDTVCWTFRGTSWLECLWHTTSQLFTNVTVEFLPVYKPSEEEKKDPGLYADNVQKLMAKALDIPSTDSVLERGVPVSKLGGLSLPFKSPPREALLLLQKNGFSSSDVEEALSRMIDRCLTSNVTTVTTDELRSLLRLKDEEAASALCKLYSKGSCVDLRQVYLGLAAVSGSVPFRSLLHTAFTMFDADGRGSLSAVQLSDLMGALLGLSQHNTAELYSATCCHDALTEDALLRALTLHPTYHRVSTEHLQPEEAGSRLSITALRHGNVVNNNKSVANGNGNLHSKKWD